METTVKEFKSGIDIPKADLNKILNDPPLNDEAATAHQKKTSVEDKDEAFDTDQEKTANADQYEMGAADKEDTATTEQEEIVAEDQKDSDFLDPDKKIPDVNGEDSSEDNNSGKTDNTSDTDKIDK